MPEPAENRMPDTPRLADLPLFDAQTGELVPIRPVRTPADRPVLPPTPQPAGSAARQPSPPQSPGSAQQPGPPGPPQSPAPPEAPGSARPPGSPQASAPRPRSRRALREQAAALTGPFPGHRNGNQNGHTAAGVPGHASLPNGDGHAPAGPDWALVRSLRRQATDLLARRSDGTIDGDAQRELGRELIGRLVEETVTEALHLGRPGLTPRAQHELAVAVFDAMFGLGRLQPLVDDPSVENIEVFGDRVRVVHDGGQVSRADPIADNDDDLVEYLRFLADRPG